jgi:hypothetical protein
MAAVPFEAAAYAYPWDLVGDPAAPELFAGLGLDHIVVAAVYHATRALTPRHPAHRVVVADHTVAYLPLDPARWTGSAPRPAPQTWLGEPDPFGTAAASLAAVGLPAHAWVVVNHVDPQVSADVGPCVVNVYGDRYPWALCPARAEVRDYAVRLAGQVAGRADVAGIEFEACGWYGFDHLHAHDKVSGVPLDQIEQFLFSLCFCVACDGEYRRSGIEPAELRSVVRTALDATFSGSPAYRMRSATAPHPAAFDTVLGADLATAVLDMRGRVADRLRAEVVEAVRSQRPQGAFPVLFHANPRSYRSTAFTGLDPATVPDGADGVVLNCWGTAVEAAETVKLTTSAARADLRVLAGLLAISGMGANLVRAWQVLDAAQSAASTGIRFYHAGLASTSDLALIRDLTASARPISGLTRRARGY